MRPLSATIVFGAVVALLARCGSGQTAAAPAPGAAPSARSDAEKVRAADVSILFVGNSHTTSHGLPDLVCEMIRNRNPGKSVYSHVVGVRFLEDVARDPTCRE